MNLGWMCPKCSRCYGPHVSQCSSCTTPVYNATTTGGSTYGGYTCAACLTWVPSNTLHYCVFSNKANPYMSVPTMWTGWTCSRCGQFVMQGSFHSFCPVRQIANTPWYALLANGHAPNWDL